jgi:hypothetical protein
VPDDTPENNTTIERAHRRKHSAFAPRDGGTRRSDRGSLLMAQQIATKSTAARLSAPALDLTEQHYIEGVERTADVLRRIYTQRGTDYGDETTLHEEGGYLYGLAVGLSLGRGATR